MKTSPTKSIVGGVEKPQEKPWSPYDGFYVGPSNIEDVKDTDPGFTIKITEEEKEKMEKTDPGFSIGPETAVGEDIAEYLTPGSIGEALLMMFPFGGVAGKSKVIQNIVKKVPGLSKLFKSGTTITKNQKIDFQKGFSDGLKAKGGVTSNNYSNLPSNIAQHNKAIDAFDNYRKGIKTRFKDKVSEAYEKIGKKVEPRYFESPQNWMDEFSLKERLKYLSKNNIKDDWLFSGGVTKKGGKYFDVDGVEIPLDPKVSYTPPNLRKNK
tara:strand:+ start:29 stop:826 length:798 start_codon:yes stop_codon:yes gene_type:complete